MPGPRAMPPYEHLYVPVGDITLHVAVASGPSRPAILLHGIGMDWRVWQAMSRRLHPWFSQYLVDLRGHGESSKPESGYSLPHYAADIEDLMDHLGLGHAVLIGSSLGAMVVASVEAPTELVSHRILVDPPLTGGPVRDPGMLERILTLKHGPTEELARYLGGDYPGSGAVWLQTMAEMWQRSADGVITDLLAQRDTAFAIEDALRLDESKTLIMRGDQTRGSVLPPEQVEAALQLLPHGKAVHVVGAGHAIHADKPVEFARLVEEFTATEE